MKKVRVIHCLGQLNTGGAETLVMNVLRNLDRESIQFDFLLFNKKEGVFDNEVKMLGGDLYYAPSMGAVGVKTYINELIDFFKKEKTDVVHSHMDWQGGFIAYAAHEAGVKKIVVHSHANQKMFENDFVHKCMIQVSKYLIKRYATTLCACSEEAGQSLFGKKKFQVIINGIDMKRYLYPNLEMIKRLRKEFDLKETDIVLGHVGSFSKNKNQEFLIDLFYELIQQKSNYKLMLVGDGALKYALEQKVKKLGLDKNVIFAGVRLDVPEIMQLMNVFLFPSIIEGLGIVAVEAQASKLQCILSDTIPREVDLGIGLVTYIPLAEKDRWIESIENKVEEKIEINNQCIRENKFNIDVTLEQLLQIYNSEKN